MTELLVYKFKITYYFPATQIKRINDALIK